MTRPLLIRKTVMAAKVETTAGTAESLTNAEGSFNIYDPILTPTIAVEERQAQGGFNKLPAVPGARSATITFSTDIGWDGTSTLPTWATVLLPACGWVNSSNTFTPRTEAPGTNVKTLTLATYVDGIRMLMYGAMGTFQWVFPAGRMGRINWTFTGVYDDVTDVSILAPTYPTAAPIRIGASSTPTYDGVALTMPEFTIDAGNSVVLREDFTATGYRSALITNRTPVITGSPETRLVATNDPYGDWVAGTTSNFLINLSGFAGSAELEIEAPQAQITNVQPGNRADVMVDNTTWTCTKASSNDSELTIIFTPDA